MTITPATESTFNRKKSFQIFFAILVLVAIGYFSYQTFQGFDDVTTDNAYVNAPQLQISAQIEGTVAAVLVGETQAVKAGELLYRIDMTEAKIAADMADADLIKTIKMVRGLVLQVKKTKQDLEKVTQDYQRRLSVQGLAAYSVEEVAHYQALQATAKTLYEQALESAYGFTKFHQITQHPDVLKSLGQVKKSYVALLRSEVRAPVDAVIAKRNAQVGQRVMPGSLLVTLIFKDTMWVDANFKENQLAQIRVGQPVALEADIYGSKVKFTGKVLGFSPGTGSSMALLPAQNATGNWVKVVQRLPVRIELDEQTLKKYPLKVGLSMVARVDTSDSRGLPLASMDHSEQISTNMFEQQYLAAQKHALILFGKANQ